MSLLLSSQRLEKQIDMISMQKVSLNLLIYSTSSQSFDKLVFSADIDYIDCVNFVAYKATCDQ